MIHGTSYTAKRQLLLEACRSGCSSGLYTSVYSPTTCTSYCRSRCARAHVVLKWQPPVHNTNTNCNRLWTLLSSNSSMCMLALCGGCSCTTLTYLGLYTDERQQLEDVVVARQLLMDTLDMQLLVHASGGIRSCTATAQAHRRLLICFHSLILLLPHEVCTSSHGPMPCMSGCYLMAM